MVQGAARSYTRASSGRARRREQALIQARLARRERQAEPQGLGARLEHGARDGWLSAERRRQACVRSAGCGRGGCRVRVPAGDVRTAAPEIPGPPFACESSVDRLNRHSDGAGFDSLLRTSPAFRRLEVFSREPRRPQDGFRPTHGVALRGLRMLLNAYPHSVVDGDTGGIWHSRLRYDVG